MSRFMRPWTLAFAGMALAALPGCFDVTADQAAWCGAHPGLCGSGTCTAATDYTSDPLNCGRCGHSCLGGACSGAVCQPVLLTSGCNYAWDVALDDTYAYYTCGHYSSSGEVHRVPKDGGADQLLAFGLNLPWGVAVDPNFVYWTESVGTSGSVAARPLDGGIPIVLSSTMNFPAGIAASQGEVFWVQTGPNALFRTRVGNPNPPAIVDTTASSSAFKVQIAGNKVYWDDIQNNRIYGIDRTAVLGTSDFTDFNGPEPAGFVIANNQGYWIGDTFGANPGIFFDPLGLNTAVDGGTQVIPVPQGAKYFLATDGQALYYSVDNDDGVVGSVLFDGGSNAVLAQHQPKPAGIATDDVAVYWVTEAGDGGVYRVAKP